MDHETHYVPNLSWWKSALLFALFAQCVPLCTVSAEWLLWTWLVFTQNVRQQVFQLTQARKSREACRNKIGAITLNFEELSIVIATKKRRLERFMRHGRRRSRDSLTFGWLTHLKMFDSERPPIYFNPRLHTR